MDLFEKMSTFVRVVEAGSFSTAASQLRLSPAAVSRQITALERSLHAQLIARTTRKMIVTTTGKRYYEQCLRILRDVDDAQSIGRDLEAGTLKINAPYTFGLARVVPHIDAFLKKHPGVRIDLRLEDRLVDLVFEGADLVIRVGSAPPERTTIIATNLTSHTYAAVASPSYLRRNGTPRTPTALAKHDGLTASMGAVDVWTFVRDGKEESVRPNVKLRSNALFALRELALAGAGVALLPEWIVTDDIRERKLRRILDDWTTPNVTVSAMYRTEQRGEPRVRAFVEHLRQEYECAREV